MDEKKDCGESEEQKKVTFNEEKDTKPNDPETTKVGSEDEGNLKDASSNNGHKLNNNVNLLGSIGDVTSPLSQEGDKKEIKEHNIRLGENRDICEKSNEANQQMQNNMSVLIMDEKKIAQNNTVEYKSVEITVPAITSDNKGSDKYLHDSNIDQEVIPKGNEKNDDLTPFQTRKVKKIIQSLDIKDGKSKTDSDINLNNASIVFSGTIVENIDNSKYNAVNQETTIISELNSLNQDKSEDKCEAKKDKEAISTVETSKEGKEIFENLSVADIAREDSSIATRNIEYQTNIDKDLYMTNIVSYDMSEENKVKEKITANQEIETDLNLTNIDQKQVKKKPEESKDFESKKNNNETGKDFPESNIDGKKDSVDRKYSSGVSVNWVQHAFIEKNDDNNEVTHCDISDVDQQIAPFKTQDNERNDETHLNMPSISTENSTICKSVNITEHNTEIGTDQGLDEMKVENNTKGETIETQNDNNTMIEKLTDLEQSNNTHCYPQSTVDIESNECNTSKVIQQVIDKDTNQQTISYNKNIINANIDNTVMDKIDRDQIIKNNNIVDNRQDNIKSASTNQSNNQGNKPQLMHTKFVEQVLKDANVDTNCDNEKNSFKLGNENNTEKYTDLKSEKTTNLQSEESKGQDNKSISMNNKSNRIVGQSAIAEEEANIECNISSQKQNSGKRVEQYAKAQSAQYSSRRTITTHADTASHKSSAGKPTSRSTRRSTRPSTGFLTDESRRKEREFFHAELHRLKDSLRKESKKIKRPKLRDHYPDVFTSLEPYYNTYTASYLINMPELGYKETQPPEATKYMEENKKKNLKDLLFTTRRTAIGLCDPWDSLDMDRSVLPKLETADIRRKRMEQIHASEMNAQKFVKSDSNEDGGDQSPHQKKPEAKQGSTRLPKFPVIAPPDSELRTKELYYGDVPMLREELIKSFSHYGEDRKKSDYNRTKEDFFRMELDRLDDYHKNSRPHMTAAYFAYLQNTPGSRKAIYDCMKEVRNSKKKEEPSLQAVA